VLEPPWTPPCTVSRTVVPEVVGCSGAVVALVVVPVVVPGVVPVPGPSGPDPGKLESGDPAPGEEVSVGEESLVVGKPPVEPGETWPICITGSSDGPMAPLPASTARNAIAPSTASTTPAMRGSRICFSCSSMRSPVPEPSSVWSRFWLV